MKYLQLIFFVLSIPAQAADKALILTDQQQTALRQILDSAVRHDGLNQVSRNAFTLSDMLDAAPLITERTTDPAPKVRSQETRP